MEVPVQKKDENEEARIVVAAYLFDNKDGAQLARYVNWPEPLKYAHLQRPKGVQVEIVGGGEAVEVSAEVPIKGVAVEVADDDADTVVWEDNCVDVVPGEKIRLGVKGLKEGDRGRLGVRFLGSE